MVESAPVRNDFPDGRILYVLPKGERIYIVGSSGGECEIKSDEWGSLGGPDSGSRSVIDCRFLDIESRMHALLIGAAEYPNQPLEGPRFDVLAVKKSLISKGIHPKNITVINPGKATKESIMNELSELKTKTNPGDFVFIYYSGLGTSAFDYNIRPPLSENSAAIIPEDVASVKTRKELLEKLIDGLRDVQPIIRDLDVNGRFVWFVLDSEYGANFLGVGSTFKYENVVFISSAGAHEKSAEIPRRMLSTFPTIDNEPHGAFTNTFLEAINGLLDCDEDQNALISYAELNRCVRSRMNERGFSHTPVMYPELSEDNEELLSRPIFH